MPLGRFAFAVLCAPPCSSSFVVFCQSYALTLRIWLNFEI